MVVGYEIKKYSPALAIFLIVEEHQRFRRHKSHVAVRINAANAVRDAITYGLRFSPGDFAVIYKKLRYCDEIMEHFYTQACAEGNISACQAYEQWKGREPFFLSGKRMCVGRTFYLGKRPMECTSFSKDGRFINIAYTIKKDGKSIDRQRLSRKEFSEKAMATAPWLSKKPKR
jgi:hypothetical protein